MYRVDLNSDLGESFGRYTIGADDKIIPLITSANVACGYHASDPVVMSKTVKLAKEAGHEGMRAQTRVYTTRIQAGQRKLLISTAHQKPKLNSKLLKELISNQVCTDLCVLNASRTRADLYTDMIPDPLCKCNTEKYLI